MDIEDNPGYFGKYIDNWTPELKNKYVITGFIQGKENIFVLIKSHRLDMDIEQCITLFMSHKTEHETKGNIKDFYEDKWKQKQKSWTYDFIDKYDDEVIPTTIYVEEREWRPKWLKWTSLFAEKRRSIDIHFSKEVGKRKGSWKGGTIGCSYKLLPNEEPLDCLKRMEKERVF